MHANRSRQVARRAARVVMVLMAIDHVRVYSGVPAGGPTAGIFFTRWVTHFCAPAFVFLAGTSAFLTAASSATPARSRAYLVTRGLVAGGARADGDSRRVDVQRRLRALHAGRRHLDARLVHGAAGGARLAADAADRRLRRVGDLRAEPRRRLAARRALPRWVALADSSTSAGVHARAERARRRRALLDRAVDRRDGGRLRLRRDHDSRARSARPQSVCGSDWRRPRSSWSSARIGVLVQPAGPVRRRRCSGC